jgi:GNAT superfamily N-acetyltransferase
LTTIEHRPPEGTEHEPYRAAALNFMARGGTAAGVREHAADAFYVKRFSQGTGIPVQQVYEYLLQVAGAIENLTEVHGLTRESAYFLARLDEKHGPYPGPDDLHVA